MLQDSSASMRVASAHVTGAACRKSPLLSIDDVYKLAERTRMRTTLEARHLLVAQTPRTARRLEPITSTPHTGLLGAAQGRRVVMTVDKSTSPISPSLREAREMEPRGTTIGREEGEGEEEGRGERGEGVGEVAPTPPPLGFVRDVRISFRSRSLLTPHGRRSPRLSLAKPETAPPAMSPRPPDIVKKVCSMCQCVPVVEGDASCPCVCADCRDMHVHSVASQRMQQTTFPALSLSHRQVTSSTLVRRARPDMTPSEIQEKIKTGVIANSALIFPRRRCRRHQNHTTRQKDDDEDDSDEEEDREKEEEEDKEETEKENEQEEKEEDEEDEELNNLHWDSNNTGGNQLEIRAMNEPKVQQGQNSDTNNKQGRNFDANDQKQQGRNSVDSLLQRRSSSRTRTPSSLNSLSLLGKLKLKLGRGEATTPLYFMDLRHMNSKIFHGRTGRSLEVPEVEEEMVGPRSDESRPLWPAFVSPRKCKLLEEPTYKAFFDPPLLAKRKQIPNPAFFAGSSDIYSLPERLPDVLEFAGGRMSITDPNTLVSDSVPKLGALTSDTFLTSPNNKAVMSLSSSFPSSSSKHNDVRFVLSKPQLTSPATSAVAERSSAVPVSIASSAVPVPSETSTASVTIKSQSAAVSSSTTTPALSQTTTTTPALSQSATAMTSVTWDPAVASNTSSADSVTGSSVSAAPAAGATTEAQ